jgi:Gluconate 2-dehydrogenase subunit 3
MAQLTRRAALKAVGAGVGTAALLPLLSDNGVIAFAQIQETHAAPNPKALSASQFETLETLVEAIIPTDDRSPGAKEARVADYIDLLLTETEPEVTLQWLGGLSALDMMAMTRFKAPFVKLNASQVDAILHDISQNERKPKTTLETFFVMTKEATITGYYTSKIGLEQELRYKGNKFLRDFVGCLTEDGKDCPYCGQKHL